MHGCVQADRLQEAFTTTQNLDAARANFEQGSYSTKYYVKKESFGHGAITEAIKVLYACLHTWMRINFNTVWYSCWQKHLHSKTHAECMHAYAVVCMRKLSLACWQLMHVHGKNILLARVSKCENTSLKYTCTFCTRKRA
jgi:hypothetical protein